MKKSLIIFALLIAGCSTSPEASSPHVISHIGTWNLYSDGHAQYTGSTPSNKPASVKSVAGGTNGDTTIVNAPNLRGLIATPGRSIGFRDSSRAGSYQDFQGASVTFEPSGRTTGSSIAQGLQNQWFGASFEVPQVYNRGSDIPHILNPSSIYVKMWYANGDTLKYLFYVSGTDSILTQLDHQAGMVY